MSAFPDPDLELGEQPGRRPGEGPPGVSIMFSQCCAVELILALATRDLSGEEQLTERQRSYRGARPSHTWMSIDGCVLNLLFRCRLSWG